jgi:hypothetical protein
VIGGLLLVALIIGAGLLFGLSPAQSVRRFLVATYDQNPTKDIRIDILSPGIDRTTLRVVVRFARDPDYGAYDDPPTWHTYTTQVALARLGVRWVPAQGGLVAGDRTYSFFTKWTDTDPVAEGQRRAKPCT